MIDCHVKYFDPYMPGLEMIPGGDWVDVRAAQVRVNGVLSDWQGMVPLRNDEQGVQFRQGDDVIISLGFAMHFPGTYEAHLLPRGSTYKRTGLIMQNQMGIIDHTYCGNKDEWIMPCIALRDGIIRRYQRVGQFRLMPRMLPLTFIQVEDLQSADRGGYGSTGDVEFVCAGEDDGYHD